MSIFRTSTFSFLFLNLQFIKRLTSGYTETVLDFADGEWVNSPEWRRPVRSYTLKLIDDNTITLTLHVPDNYKGDDESKLFRYEKSEINKLSWLLDTRRKKIAFSWK